ncbi:MAG: NAD(P)/FAD-dependent oxidoreductase [Clostridiales bacterium]|nr:NAD(P)/FAD-dependent oxidoreductase [Clostridiales bacterium]
MKKVVVIGGGPAGMIAAGNAALNGNDVILFEKNEKLGKKLYITGKGRCNLTNASDPETLIKNTIGNPYFMYSAYYSFGSERTMEFFEGLGVSLKVERGNRVFPKSDKSSDIIKALDKFLKNSGVNVKLNSEIVDIIIEDNKVLGVVMKGKEKVLAQSVIIATGGLSYPVTGSDGAGYVFAKKGGHIISGLYPSLVPLKVSQKWCYILQGLSLKNISIEVKIRGKSVYKDFGEMMFTHFGVTGPLILSASRYITKRISENPEIYIDLKPALTEKELDLRILKDFEKFINRTFKNCLNELLPQKMIPVIIELSKINPDKRVNEITKEERKRICYLLKNLKLNIADTRGFSEAIITCGGINVNEIDPSTMKSKIIDGLSFAGEVIDVDCFTGGFNLQVAFSTGYLAGINV